MTKWALHFFHCLTPMHIGAEEGASGIDRALLRESTTGFPYIPSSTLKGAHKALVAANTNGVGAAAFGASGKTGNQGCLLWGDASLLALPIRSEVGSFAWVTCPLLVARLVRWAEIGGGGEGELATAARSALTHAAVAPGTALGGQGKDLNEKAWNDCVLRPDGGDTYFLGRAQLSVEKDAGQRDAWGSFASGLAVQLFATDTFWTPFFRSRAILVCDDDFSRLIQNALLVEAQIEIDDSRGVTVDGSLRYTESLPAEVVLVSAVRCEAPLGGSASIDDVWALFQGLAGERAGQKTVQLGADESKGRGLMRPTWLGLS